MHLIHYTLMENVTECQSRRMDPRETKEGREINNGRRGRCKLMG